MFEASFPYLFEVLWILSDQFVKNATATATQRHVIHILESVFNCSVFQISVRSVMKAKKVVDSALVISVAIQEVIHKPSLHG